VIFVPIIAVSSACFYRWFKGAKNLSFANRIIVLWCCLTTLIGWFMVPVYNVKGTIRLRYIYDFIRFIISYHVGDLIVICVLVPGITLLVIGGMYIVVDLEKILKGE